MAEEPPPNSKPILHKPPGYRDPTAPLPAAVPRPPPRKQQLPTSFDAKGYRRRRSRSCSGRRFCCCCFLFLFLVLLSLAAVGALFYLWFDPKLPIFHLQSLKTPAFNVSVLPDGTFLDATTLVSVQATNPNAKIGFSYATSQARVAIADDEGDVELGTGSFPEFSQGKNSTMMKFEEHVKGMTVDDGVGSRLKARFRSKSIQFVVDVRSRLSLRLGSKRSGTVPVRILCDAVSLKQLQGGALPECVLTFPLFKWINVP